MNMKIRFVGLIIVTSFFFFSCGSEGCVGTVNIPQFFNQTVYADNINTIDQYLADNNLQADTTASGLRYIVETEGSEAKPTTCNSVFVQYRGYLPDGSQFDSSGGEFTTFSLQSVILGWQEGIPLFGRGGKGTLLIPSYLAYGENPPAGSIIPGNSVLLFDIELEDF